MIIKINIYKNYNDLNRKEKKLSLVKTSFSYLCLSSIFFQKHENMYFLLTTYLFFLKKEISWLEKQVWIKK
jgi:hypothetical protein